MNYSKLLTKAKEAGLEDFELIVNSNKDFSIEIFDHKVENNTVAELKKFSARGIYNGKIGTAYTEKIDDVESLIQKVIENAKIIEDNKEVLIFGGSKSYKPNIKSQETFSKVSALDKMNLCLDAENYAYSLDKRVDKISVSYSEGDNSTLLINTKGLKRKFGTSYYNFFVEAIVKDGDDTRTDFAYIISDKIEELDYKKLAKEAVDGAISKLHGGPCASKKYKVVLSPIAMSSLTGAFMRMLDGDAVNKGKSLLKDKLNTQVASKKLTITEIPICKQYPYRYRNCDDEGVATYNKKVIDKGVLTTFFYNLEAAKKAGVESTGNGYNGAVGWATLEIKDGKTDLEGIYKKVNNGIYINDLQGLHAGINPMSGNFSLQASGYLIKDGKRGEPVNLITVAGNLTQLLQDVVLVGNDSKLNYNGIKSPSVVIKSLAISGK